MGMGFPRPGSAVKFLLVANIAVFFLQIIFQSFFKFNLSQLFGVVPEDWWQVWRYVTFQFLHGGIGHILLNMLGLYFLGMYLERDWGPARFLRFYLICGMFAGLAHVLLVISLKQDLDIPLIGASGGVYAVLLACAILYPHIKLMIFPFPFLISIRIVIAIFIGISIFGIVRDIGGAVSGRSFSYSRVADMAHLGGAAAGAIWVLLGPRFKSASQTTRTKLNQGAWDRRLKKRQDVEKELDRILNKIHNKGIQSLTPKEKKTLADATREQKLDERDIFQ